MLKHITGTFFTRIVVSLANFAIIIITARLMGAEARGNISLAMLAIAIAGLINEVIGGPAVVFLIPRYNNRIIIKYAYLWGLLTSLSCSSITAFLGLYEMSLFPFVCVGSLLLCTGSIHLFVLLGHQQIKAFNQIAVLQSVLLFIVFVSFMGGQKLHIEFYFYALIVAYATAFLYGRIKINKLISFADKTSTNIGFSKLFQNGIYTQLASIFHLLSSRISFYFSEYFLSLAFVGVLSTAVSVTEAAMLFSSSVALITVGKVANETNQAKATASVINLIKLSVMISVCLLCMLCLLPGSVLMLIFGKEFFQLKVIILTMIPGALASSISQVISHYYTGVGRFKVNTTAGIISLGCSLAAATIYLFSKSVLLPGLIISVSAIAAMIYFVGLFLKEQQLKITDIIPGPTDMIALLHKFNSKAK
jgi:O-antigen/teichoic acid export membrane protein